MNPDQFWTSLSPTKRLAIFNLFRDYEHLEEPDVDHLSPTLPGLVIEIISTMLRDDPETYCSLRGACKEYRDFLQDFHKAFKGGSLLHSITRFAVRTSRHLGSKVQIWVGTNGHKPIRYLKMGIRGKTVPLANIDRCTGIILSGNMVPMGTVYDEKPEEYIRLNSDTLVPRVKIREYQEKRKLLGKRLSSATSHSKSLTSKERTAFFLKLLDDDAILETWLAVEVPMRKTGPLGVGD